ncbi:MAG: hypothetical protein NTZ00_00895 [Bacteroidetes bacterium]|nr:hypothetical protein [Bacteroidota bacterium]
MPNKTSHGMAAITHRAKAKTTSLPTYSPRAFTTSSSTTTMDIAPSYPRIFI